MIMVSQQQIQIIHNNSLIQNNYALSVILKSKSEQITDTDKGDKSSSGSIRIRGRISDEIYFLVCQSCFWCASFINNDTFTARTGKAAPPPKCPICIRGNIDSMPIAENEEYKSVYDSKHGVVVEFLK
jgi:hypothetical protein